jgi:cobalt-precorrin-5B (C1)-methyltransferase
MRTGFTTGSCATAAAKGAALALIGDVRDTVEIGLPGGRRVSFFLAYCRRAGDGYEAGVVKDAGDDPDVTHGATITAKVRRRDGPGVTFIAGPGVGTVTRPGLGLEVGGPAINPVPRQMIALGLVEALGPLDEFGVEVTVGVVGGEMLAKKTLNGRLGIMGGLSILGTTGIVRPYSTAAWRASVGQGIDVGLANGVTEFVLSTGGRSEKFAMALRPDLPEAAFVELGEFTGFALDRCKKVGVRRVVLVGMIGKFSKVARGHMMTHVAGNQVDTGFLAELAASCGATPEEAAAIADANTARHVQELAEAWHLDTLFDRICTGVVEQSTKRVKSAFPVEAIMFNFAGGVLGRAASDTLTSLEIP